MLRCLGDRPNSLDEAEGGSEYADVCWPESTLSGGLDCHLSIILIYELDSDLDSTEVCGGAEGGWFESGVLRFSIGARAASISTH